MLRRVETQATLFLIDIMTLILDELVRPVCIFSSLIVVDIYWPTSHFTKQSSGQTVLSYVNMVCATLRNSIPKSIVYCQVREAKRSLLDHFFTELGAREVRYFLRLKGIFVHVRLSWCYHNCHLLSHPNLWNTLENLGHVDTTHPDSEMTNEV